MLKPKKGYNRVKHKANKTGTEESNSRRIIFPRKYNNEPEIVDPTV